jgi:hypothetical protein
MRQELDSIYALLNQILEQRDRLFPKRDPQNTAAMREAMTAYANALRNVQRPGWKPEEALTKKAKKIAENAVFVCGYMKSGTTLLLELLDGHPELIVMPGDSHMIRFIEGRAALYNKVASQSNTPYTGRLKDWDTYWVSRLVNPTGQKPFWILGDKERPYLDFLLYLNYWLEHLPPSDRSPFLAVVLAFYCANPRRAASPKLWVAKTPGNEERVGQILDLFPSARFVHIVRDPRPNMASLKRLYEIRGWAWKAESVASSVRNAMETGLLNQECLGKDKYHRLRYEDLVTNPEVEMRKVALFLGITIDEVLLCPTVNSLPAKCNSMYKDRQIRGKILATLSDKWRNELDPYEQEAILAILYPAAKRLGYEWNAMYYYRARFRHLTSRMLRRVRR